MNSFQRVMNRLQGKPVDRIPNLSIVMMFAAKELGVPYSDCCRDYRLLADAAFLCHERYGIDMVCAISDSLREAEGFGTEVIFPNEGVPYAAKLRLQNLSDIDSLKVIEPSQSVRMSDTVEAVRLMRQRAGNDVPVVGWVEGALAESCDLMDMQQVFINLLDEPEVMHRLLDLCTKQGILFAKAQIEAGAHIMGIGDSAASLVGPSLYEEFVLPYQQRLIDAIHEMSVPVKLHICGNIGPVMHLVAKTANVWKCSGHPRGELQDNVPCHSRKAGVAGCSSPASPAHLMLNTLFPERKAKYNKTDWDFSVSPVVKTPHFHCSGAWDPRSEN